MVSKEFKEDGNGFKIRRYTDYKDYTEHQKSKLAKITWIDKYDVDYRRVLTERLREISGADEFGDKRVLCLAARAGTEVKAFKDLNAFSVGIDLNPGENNQHVVHGDFHDIQFPDSCVDVVFTNSIDHSLNPKKMMSEIYRVLNIPGLLIMELGRGTKDDNGGGSGSWECLEWEKIDDVIKFVEKQGFNTIYQKAFNAHGRYTWGGRMVVFEINDN